MNIYFPQLKSKNKSLFLKSLLTAMLFLTPFKLTSFEFNKFKACKKKWNCVSSQEDKRSKYYIEPLLLGNSKDLTTIKKITSTLKRTKILKSDKNYIKVEFKSYLFGFIDYVEFTTDYQNKLIHVKSESQSGYWDFGVNRRRVEDIRERYLKNNN